MTVSWTLTCVAVRLVISLVLACWTSTVWHQSIQNKRAAETSLRARSIWVSCAEGLILSAVHKMLGLEEGFKSEAVLSEGRTPGGPLNHGAMPGSY